MSLKRNIIANYISQIYVTLIGIFMVPMYVSYMGVEAYGLVGFFAMLQAWFQLLDMGLTPTMARETARYNGGASDSRNLRNLLRILEGIFIGIALFGATAMIYEASTISKNWLKVRELSFSEVENAIILMAVIIASRWVSGLYRGVITGFERMVWLSSFNTAIATARFILVIPFFIYVGANPTHFFSYQLVIASIELLILFFKTYSLLPKRIPSSDKNWNWAPLRSILKFSLSIAFTSSVWVLVTQTDKLILSKLLPLAEYAYFTLAVLVASGVSVISGPISNALLPRLAKLAAANDDDSLVKLYRLATQTVAAIAIPTTLVLTFFSKQVLLAWTGNEIISSNSSQILALYALGNGFLALGAFPYYLQYAKGDLRLHMIGNIIFIIILIPSLILATIQYGIKGAGYAWLFSNIFYFLIWVPRVHNRFFKGLHTKWFLYDVAPIMLSSFIFTFFIKNVFTFSESRSINIIYIFTIGILSLFFALFGSSNFREIVKYKWKERLL